MGIPETEAGNQNLPVFRRVKSSRGALRLARGNRHGGLDGLMDRENSSAGDSTDGVGPGLRPGQAEQSSATFLARVTAVQPLSSFARPGRGQRPGPTQFVPVSCFRESQS
jgi:hypothetical protein